MTFNSFYQGVMEEFQFVNSIRLDNTLTQPLQQLFVHPISLINAKLINDIIIEKNNTVIILPNRYYSVYWASYLSLLIQIRNNYQSSEKFERYKHGQKLLFNNKLVVEFIKFLTNGGLSIKTSDAKVTIHNEFKGLLKAIDSQRPLSNTRRLLRQLNAAESELNPLDKILKISTMGDTSFYRNKTYLLGKTMSGYEFFTNRIINGQSIDDIINVGKISYNGQSSAIGTGQAAFFNILLSHDLMKLRDYLETNENPEEDGIVVADSASFITSDLGSFADITEKYMYPFIVFSDASDIEEANQLKSYGFKYWLWTENALKSLPENSNVHSYFSQISDSVTKNINITLTVNECKCNELEKIISFLNRIEKRAPDDNIFLKQDLSKLYGLALLFTRMEAFPNIDFLKIINEKINDVENNIEKHSIFVKTELTDLIKSCVENIKKITDNPENFMGDKINKINNYIVENKKRKIYLLVRQHEHIDMVKDYWKNKLHKKIFNKITFLSLIELMNDSIYKQFNGIDSSLIICGWLNKNNMQRIIFNQIAFSDLQLFFYKYESDWYGFSMNYWSKLYSSMNISEELIEKYQINEESNVTYSIFSVHEKSTSNKNDDIFKLEKRIRSYSNFQYKGSDNSTHVKTRKLSFSSDKIMFATESHVFFIINEHEHIHNNENLIDFKTRDKLKFGDRVILSRAEKQILKEKADELLANDGLSESRQLASLWKSALLDFFILNDHNTGKVRKKLSDAGCLINIVTLRGWLFDETRIGPRNENHLDVISSLTNNSDFIYQLDNVKKSIRMIRSYHQKAAFAIKRDFIKNLSTVFQSSDLEMLESNDYYETNIDPYGKIVILKLIGSDLSNEYIDLQFVNKLIDESN